MGSYISYSNSDNHQPLDSKWYNILSDAPIDIVRLILELAAQDDRATAASFSLVSKDVNAWITPILYKTVEFSKLGHMELAERGYPSLRYTETLVLLDTEQSMENGLYTFMVPDPDLLVKSCPSLSELHVSENTVRGIHEYTCFPHLRRLIVRGPTYLRPGEFAFVPIYPSLTHLAFIHDIPRSFARKASESLPNLTHFACSYRVCGLKSETPYLDSSAMLADQLALLLDNILTVPSIRVIVVLVQDFLETHDATITNDEREMQIHRLLKRVPQRNHKKVVPFYLSSLENQQKDDMPEPELWDVFSRRSFWSRAEEVIKSREA